MLDIIRQTIGQIVALIQNVDPGTWALLGTVLGLSTLQHGVVLALQAKGRQIGERTNLALTFALQSIPASVDYAVNFASANPHVLPAEWLAVVGASQPIYRFIVKPALNYIVGILTDARAYRAAQAGPAEIDV